MDKRVGRRLAWRLKHLRPKSRLRRMKAHLRANAARRRKQLKANASWRKKQLKAAAAQSKKFQKVNAPWRKKQLKATAARRKKYLRLRKKLTEHPRLRSVADYARDAQRDRTLLRFTGRNVPGARAAMANKDVLKRRHKRTLEFAGNNNKWYSLFLLAFLGGCVGAGIAGYLVTGYMDPTGSRGFNPWVNGLGSSLLGGGIAMGGLYAIYLRSMWSTAFDMIHIVEHAVKSKPWLLTAIVRVYMPRLGFAAHDYGRVFSGGARNSGVLEGSVVLQLEAGMKAESLTHVKDVYKLRKKEGRYSGTSTRAIDGRVERVVNLSKRRAALKSPEKHAWLDKAGPYAVIVACIIYLILANGGGV